MRVVGALATHHHRDHVVGTCSPEAAAPMGSVRERNVLYRARTQQQFLSLFGAG